MLEANVSEVRSKEVVENDWIDDSELWFPPGTPLPGARAARVADGPFGNDRLASAAEVAELLKDQGGDDHLALDGVTLVCES
jgi:hypothetical protein